MKRKNDALVVVDVQNDFCSGGNLAIAGGEEVVPVINGLMPGFGTVVATQDWHPPGHGSFASSNPGASPFQKVDRDGDKQVLWPDHCVQGTTGADFHPGLDLAPVHVIVRKGYRTGVDSYSAFRENDRKTPTGLEGCLKSLGVERVFICGLALDYCVFYSALDAIEMNFGVAVITDACRGIDSPPGDCTRKIKWLKKSGIAVIKTSDV